MATLPSPPPRGAAHDSADAAAHGPPTPLWIRAVLLVNVIVAIIGAILMIATSHDGGEGWERRVYALLIAAPVVGAVWLVGKPRPRPLAYGVAAGSTLAMASVAMVVAVLMWPGEGSHGAEIVQAKLMLLLFALVQVAALIWAARSAAALDAAGSSREAWMGFLAVYLWPTAAAIVSSRLGGSISIDEWRRNVRGERALVHAAVRIQHCAGLYGAAHAGAGYPASLEVMRAGRGACLDDETSKPTRMYSLVYAPAVPDDDGRIPSFTVSGRMKSGSMPLSVFGDTSGALRRSRLAPASEATTPGDGMPEIIGGLRDCVEELGAEPPATAAQLLRAAKTGNVHASLGLCDGWASSHVVSALDSEPAAYTAAENGYRVTYVRSGDGYRIEARPVKFAETALRSYALLAGDEAIHYTLQDRAATADDPELPPCLPYDSGDCTPTPAAAVPRAAFVHERVMPIEGSYSLHVRVEGAPTHVPVGLYWSFDCDVRPPNDTVTAIDWRSAVAVGVPSRDLADHGCPNLGPAHPPIGDTLVVRLWLRGAGGETARIQDTILVDHGGASP